MTEVEWLTNSEPGDLIEHVRATASDRRLRLLGCACVRRLWHLLTPLQRECVEVNERYADGVTRTADVTAIRKRVYVAFHADTSGSEVTRNAALACYELSHQHIAATVTSAVEKAARARAEDRFGFKRQRHVANKNEKAIQLAFARDIFGNPFRHMIADPAWFTPTVVALADGIYADRAFDRLPILADALQDAGCNRSDLLAHCRDSGLVHVRGCWGVDLLLGESQESARGL